MTRLNKNLSAYLKEFELVYKTSITPFFPICQVGRHYSRSFTDILCINNKPQETLVLINKAGVNWYFPHSLKPIALKYIDRLLSERTILEKLEAREKELARKLLREIKTPLGKLVKNGRATGLGCGKLLRLFDLYYEYGYVADVPGFLFQVYAVSHFKDRVRRRLIKAGKKSLATEVNLDLLLTSPAYTNYEKFLRCLSTLKSKKSFNIAAGNWFWLIHDYIGDIIDAKYLKRMLGRLEIEQIKRDLIQAGNRIKAIRELKKAMPAGTREEIEVIQGILWIYNEKKKKVLNKVNIYLRYIFQSRFPGISFDQLRKVYQHSPNDLQHIFASRLSLPECLKDEEHVYFIRRGEISSGPSELLSLLHGQSLEIAELRGRTACPGIVRGRINIVLNISQISKFLPGDILVAPFTNVNYFPIMSKASAILTETGGLTSHAAIVSRELNIPCIVGIPHLISKLYDGQEVEVDAKKGTVKLI